MLAFLAAIAPVPVNDMPLRWGRRVNLEAMQHPVWDAIRPSARDLLMTLGLLQRQIAHSLVCSPTHPDFLNAPPLESVDTPKAGGIVKVAGPELVRAWLDDHARRQAVYRLDDGMATTLATRRIDATTIQNGQVLAHLDR